MSTPISNKDLLQKCREFIVSDLGNESLTPILKDALITANREILALGGDKPLAWLRQSYDELFTRAYAGVSNVTNTNPGVITADSFDEDLSSDHGFQTGDIVFTDGFAEMKRMNRRFFIATRASATTITLTQLDGSNAIDTTDYETYSAGGYIYHAGIKLPASTIEPSSGSAGFKWKIKTVWDVTFDGHPAFPISEEAQRSDVQWMRPQSRPERWRYWRSSRADPTSYDHYILFPPTSDRYVINVNIEKGYPDLSVWTDSAYPPHPPEVHDFVWRRALCNTITNAERQRREAKTAERVALRTQIEVLYAQDFLRKRAEDERAIKNLSRKMIGFVSSRRGFGA